MSGLNKKTNHENAGGNRETGNRENCDFAVVTQNCRGLRDTLKRKTVFEYLKGKAEICFLQETHSTNDIEKDWKSECDGEVFYSHGTHLAQGVLN